MSEQVIFFILGVAFAFLIALLFRDFFIRRVFENFIQVKSTKDTNIEFIDAEIEKLLNLVNLNAAFVDELINELESDGNVVDPKMKENLLNLKQDLVKKAEAIHLGMGDYDDIEPFK